MNPPGHFAGRFVVTQIVFVKAFFNRDARSATERLFLIPIRKLKLVT